MSGALGGSIIHLKASQFNFMALLKISVRNTKVGLTSVAVFSS